MGLLGCHGTDSTAVSVGPIVATDGGASGDGGAILPHGRASEADDHLGCRVLRLERVLERPDEAAALGYRLALLTVDNVPSPFARTYGPARVMLEGDEVMVTVHRTVSLGLPDVQGRVRLRRYSRMGDLLPSVAPELSAAHAEWISGRRYLVVLGQDSFETNVYVAQAASIVSEETPEDAARALGAAESISPDTALDILASACARVRAAMVPDYASLARRAR